MNDKNKASLFIVSTPIGNLADITFRAVETLKNVEIIFAEDTRVSGVLLKKYDIKTKLDSYYEHNKMLKINKVLSFLEDGKNVALISDAGTPGVSDPGFELICEVIKKGFNVTSIPGAFAGICALVTSGIEIQPHLFIGFLPKKENEKKKILEEYKMLKASLIIYESPFRINKTIKLLHTILGNRKVSLSREITKLYETIYRDNLEDAVKREYVQKGEYVIIVEGYKKIKNEINDIEILKFYKKYLKEGYSDKESLLKVAENFNISKNKIYKILKIDNKI